MEKICRILLLFILRLIQKRPGQNRPAEDREKRQTRQNHQIGTI